jgi:hypothetical protein
MSLLSGPQSQSYWVDFSTNLTDWAELSFMTLTNTPTAVVDDTAPLSPQRFYRARKAD